MKPRNRTHELALLALGLTSTVALATNGDNLIGIGPISRSLGGTGVAAPQDAISAVFSNPAAMCLSPACAQPQADLALTLFMPDVSTSINNADGYFGADGDDKVYPIPAIGVSMPLGDQTSRWRLGIAAFGVSGLGVDYRGTAVDQPKYFNFGLGGTAPLAAGTYTDLAIMKFAPSIGFAATPELSFGLSAHFDYATLDLGYGAKNDIGYGVQIGMVWKPVKDLMIGLTYISPQSTTFDNVTDFDSNGRFDSLELEAPQQVAIGFGWTGLDDRLLIEIDGRWLNWSDAAGYKEFDWEDEWVVGLGAQYEVVDDCVWLRAGYNYGTNPVRKHNGWNGALTPTGPADTVNVQGKEVARYYYENFRTVGFPAIVKHHLSLGVGWHPHEDWLVNFAWVHAFKNDISGSGTDPFGRPVTLKSELAENSIDMAVTWRF